MRKKCRHVIHKCWRALATDCSACCIAFINRDLLACSVTGTLDLYRHTPLATQAHPQLHMYCINIYCKWNDYINCIFPYLFAIICQKLHTYSHYTRLHSPDCSWDMPTYKVRVYLEHSQVVLPNTINDSYRCRWKLNSGCPCESLFLQFELRLVMVIWVSNQSIQQYKDINIHSDDALTELVGHQKWQPICEISLHQSQGSPWPVSSMVQQKLNESTVIETVEFSSYLLSVTLTTLATLPIAGLRGS